MEFRVLYSKMWQCSTTLSCSGIVNWRWCCSVLRNDRTELVSLAFSLPSLRSSVQVGLRKDFPDFARNSMSPEIGCGALPCN